MDTSDSEEAAAAEEAEIDFLEAFPATSGDPRKRVFPKDFKFLS